MQSLKTFISISFIFLFFPSIIAQCVLYEDDFETGTIGSIWTGQTNLFQIDSTNPGSGNYSLTSNADFTSLLNGISFDFPDFNPSIFTFKVMSSNTNLTGSSTIILGNNLTNFNITSNGNTGLFFINFFNNNLRIIGDTTIFHPAFNNTWYEVLFDDFNWLNQTADLYINGTLICPDLGFRHNMSSVSKIMLNGGTQNNFNLTYSSWDMIQIGSSPTITNIDTTICYGESYTFSDGNVINNITNDTNYTSILAGPGICDIITNTVIHTHQNQFQFTNDTIFHCTNQNGNSTTIQADTNYLSYLWSDSSTLSNFTSNSNQWIGLTVIDSLGCEGFSSVFTEFISVDTLINYALSSGFYTNETNASFQWLNCNDSLKPINGETNDTIAINTWGDFNFALEINKKGCIDTSGCNNLSMFIDITEETNKFKISPNPFKEFIEIYNPYESSDLMIFDLNGRLLHRELLTPNSENKVALSSLNKGFYMLILKNSTFTKKSTIIKF